MLSGIGGGVFDGSLNHQPTSPNSYLTTGYGFWTITPIGGYNPISNSYWATSVFLYTDVGIMDDGHPDHSQYLRPVINIRNDVTINGSGTKEDPYTVS